MADINFAGWLIILIVIALFLVPIILLIMKKKSSSFKINMIPVEKTFTNELDAKFKLIGNKLKSGKVIKDFRNVGKIDKYMKTKMFFPDIEKKDDGFHPIENKEGETQGQEVDLAIFKLKNNLFLWRWLGVKKNYLIVREKDEKGTDNLKFDDRFNRVQLPEKMDIYLYGNIWTDSLEARQYLNSISQIFEMQQERTLSQNTANRVSALEIEHAQKERLAKVFAEIEKGKYEEIKKKEDEILS